MNNASKDIWFTVVTHNTPIAIGYCAPERLTEGTYNLYAIAVHKDFQGKGVGKQMMHYIATKLRENGNRIILVETSGKTEFERTRTFYRKCHYIEQATIPEFYDKDDDKIIFWKRL